MRICAKICESILILSYQNLRPKEFHKKIVKKLDKSVQILLGPTKGQLILKANCHAEDSSKKRTNEFVFTSVRRVFVRFLEEIDGPKKPFRN